MDRLNREFKTLTLNSVELDDDQLNQLVRIYLDNCNNGYRQKRVSLQHYWSFYFA